MAILMIAALPGIADQFQPIFKDKFQQDLHLSLSVEAALEWAQTEPEKAARIQVILLAQEGPGDALPVLKSHAILSQAPVLLLVPNKGLENAAILKAGVQDLLPYPPRAAELQGRIQTALALFEAHQAQKKLEQELAEAHIQLQSFADMDPLTHLSKRLTFEQQLKREWRRALRDRHYLSLLLLDMDLLYPFTPLLKNSMKWFKLNSA